MTDAEQKEWDLKLRKLDAEIAKLYTETRWHPFVVVGGIIAALNISDILNRVTFLFIG